MDAQDLEKLRKAGRIARDCREWARENIKPGVRLAHILETVDVLTSVLRLVDQRPWMTATGK